MVTTKGTMTIALDPVAAPKTVNNFVFLARYHYYDGMIFHRIIPGFVLQGGDPQGTGGAAPATGSRTSCRQPGRYEIGSLAMANAGPNTNGSQFFIISGHERHAAAAAVLAVRQGREGLDVVLELEKVGTPGAGVPKREGRHRVGDDHRVLATPSFWLHLAAHSASSTAASSAQAGRASRPASWPSWNTTTSPTPATSTRRRRRG